MFLESVIDQGLIKVYLETEYRVHSTPAYTLEIGKPNTHLLADHQLYRTDCSAFLTAWNPYSQIVADSENSERHISLISELETRGLKFIDSLGQHPSNEWPGEVSVLIFGLSLEAAKTLGIRFGQNAIVWNGSDAVPQLVLLR